MKQSELVQDFRVTAQDIVKPHIFADDDVARWLIEAEQEAAIRGRLIFEASDDFICEIDLIPEVATYPLHKSIYEIVRLGFVFEGETRRHNITLKSREWVDALGDFWEGCHGAPSYAYQDDTSITFVPTPGEATGTVRLEGYRTPIRGLSADKNSKPEIHEAHHRHLVNWALYRAFRLPDNDAMDLGRSDEALAAFTQYFGIRPDSDLRRITRHDVQHHVDAFWP